jgi:L-alanine-DL-glutamate epimerase-like enolase superfamily enzyme
MKIKFKEQSLPFHYPFTISGGRTKTHQRALIVSIEINGITGYGEAPEISYYNIPVAKMISDLQERILEIEQFQFTEPPAFWGYLNRIFPDNSFLVCALDMACWDLYGKMQGKLLFELWGSEWENIPLTDYTIGLDSIVIMQAKLRKHKWPVYKIKLGTDHDIEIIKALRDCTDAPFRIDANAAWTIKEALIKITELKNLGVELIEQPLHKDNFGDMAELIRAAALPLFADESCVIESDVEKCAGYFHGINIKLTKCGGITPALRMIAKARELNLLVMMGNMNESSIGTAALANFLPLIDAADMDGPLLLIDDIAEGLEYNYGKLTITGKAGLGIEVRQLFE